MLWADADECSREDACAQHCHNTLGSYSCACAPGYNLHADGRNCIAINGNSTVLIYI